METRPVRKMTIMNELKMLNQWICKEQTGTRQSCVRQRNFTQHGSALHHGLRIRFEDMSSRAIDNSLYSLYVFSISQYRLINCHWPEASNLRHYLVQPGTRLPGARRSCNPGTARSGG